MDARTYVMPEGDCSEIVMDLFHEYEELILYAADRYTVTGKYDKEDAQQECVTLLWEMLVDGWDPTTVDFRKIYKTRMWHRLMDRANYLTRGCRDHRRQTTLYTYQVRSKGQVERSTVDGDDLSKFTTAKYSSSNPKYRAAKFSADRDPAEIVSEEEWVGVLLSKLNDEEQQVFTAMLSDFIDVDDIDKSEYDTRKSLRAHFDKRYTKEQMRRKHVPLYVYADVTGLEQRVVQRCVQGIRKKYQELLDVA